MNCDDLQLSKIGLGTWAIGGGGWKFGWGPQDDKESIKVIHAVIDNGINWIDTAPLYGFGHAETIIGRAIKSISNKPFIATKCGLQWNQKRDVSHNLTAKNIRIELESSLRRLKLDNIDIYFIHWPSPKESIIEAWELISRLIEEGKIRKGGVSNFSPEEIELLGGTSIPSYAQNEFNYLKRNAQKELIPHCAAAGIKFIAYGVLNKGLTTGKFSNDFIKTLPFDDHRKRDIDFTENSKNISNNYINKLYIAGVALGLTPAQYSIRWALEQPDIHAVICGMRTVKQVEENTMGDGIVL